MMADLTGDKTSPTDDLEAQWGELGRRWFDPRPGDDRADLWFFPVLLLYTGFFFGPFATTLAAAFTVRGKFPPRDAAIILGACGAGWCLLQGISLYNGAWWSEVELQGTRSAMNFGCGVVAYVVVRRTAVEYFRPTRATILITSAIIVLAVLCFIATPGSLLVAMGR